MSEFTDRIHAEADELRALRDQLKVQIHLGAMDAQAAFEEAEKSWEHLEAKLALLARESRASAGDIGEAAKLLLGQIREGYRRVKDLI